MVICERWFNDSRNRYCGRNYSSSVHGWSIISCRGCSWTWRDCVSWRVIFFKIMKLILNIVKMYKNFNFFLYNSTATATVSTVIAGASGAHSIVLNYELRNVREQFSQFLQEMQTGLINIGVIISHCESHWERQIVEIEGIIEKLER